jgi:hypothetical protein
VDAWLPEAALEDLRQALKCAREFGQAGTLMYALGVTPSRELGALLPCCGEAALLL